MFGSVAAGRCARADISVIVCPGGGRELFSFDVMRLGELPRTVVIVGPNGAGKTNLLRLVDVVRAAIERSATYSDES
jgi:ABC-type transport system involved in cytochrome c biogenesis ATPase subunit